jgi:hypothetical protein
LFRLRTFPAVPLISFAPPAKQRAHTSVALRVPFVFMSSILYYCRINILQQSTMSRYNQVFARDDDLRTNLTFLIWKTRHALHECACVMRRNRFVQEGSDLLAELLVNLRSNTDAMSANARRSVLSQSADGDADATENEIARLIKRMCIVQQRLDALAG